MSWRRLLAGICVLVCLAIPVAPEARPALPASAQEPAEAELVEEILELQRRIDELLARLPPDLRAEVEERLAQERLTQRAAEPVPEAEPTPEPEPAPMVVDEPAPPPPTPPPPPRRRRRPTCNTLTVFDENEDGKVDAADRFWRYLYLWLDKNGNGQVDAKEMASPFDRKVREIAVDLDTFERTKGMGEIRLREHVVLDLRGDGFGERARGDDAVLAVDATALGRRGGPRLLAADGTPVEGVVPFRRGYRIRQPSGEVVELTCP